MRTLCIAVLLIGIVAGCSGKEAPEAATGAGKPAVAVEAQAFAPRTVEETVEVVGTLAPKFESVVRSEVRGLVSEVYVTQWVPVSAGQPLAKMDTRDFEISLERARAGVEAAKGQELAAKSAEAATKGQEAAARSQEEAAKAGLLEAEVAAERAEREFQRLLKLKESGLATQQSLDDAHSARDAAAARVKAVKAQIESSAAQTAAAAAQVEAAHAQARGMQAQVKAAEDQVRQVEVLLSKAVVRSPMNGVIAERMVNAGDMPGDGPLFRIVDNRLLDLTVSVPSGAIASVRKGQEIGFATDALPGEIFQGTVMFINPGADPSDRSVRVTAEVKNADGRLKGGLFVKGRIVTGRRADVLEVPKSALLSRDVAAGTADLFIVEGAKAKKVRIATGADDGDWIEVVSGIPADARVVTRGGYNILDGDPVNVVAAEGAK